MDFVMLSASEASFLFKTKTGSFAVAPAAAEALAGEQDDSTDGGARFFGFASE
jgi:hypothetical protein